MIDASECNSLDYETKMVSQLYVEKICRSCLCEVNRDYFWLESYYLDRKVVDIYKNVTSVVVKTNDDLPKKLCVSCYNNIIKFDFFKNKVLESEEVLAKRVILKSEDIFKDITELKTDNSEHIEKTDIEFESDSNDSQGHNDRDNASEDETPISKRLQKGIETAQEEVAESDTRVDPQQEELKHTESCGSVVPTAFQGASKARLRRRVKRKAKKKTDINSVEDKKKRERRKESCSECGKVILAYKMENHRRTHTKEKPYDCEKCGARFSEKSNLNRHVKTHGNDRPYKCPICGKGFLRPSSRSIHEMTAHNSEKHIFCPICSKAFKHPYFLNKHISNIHNKTNVQLEIEGSGYPCPVCGNFYRTKSSLNVHKMKHEEPRGFLCNVCGKAFSTKGVLENHQKVHTGEKNFSCNICNKKFRFITTLKTHVLVHSGEKPLSCHICSKQFRQHSHLNTHMRGQHFSNRPYQCSFCSKAFKQSSNLRVHTRIHTGETPYHCDICQKGFYDSSSMKKHKKIHFDKNVLPVIWEKMDLDLIKLENNILQT